MKYGMLLLGLLFTLSLTAQKVQPIRTYNDFQTFKKEILEAPSDQPTLINFWATWCKPCMEEMPIFLDMYRSDEYKDVNFVFVSMDFKKDVETKLRDYITKENILQNTVVLDAPKPSKWIDKVSEQWSGALPFTLVMYQDARATHGGKFDSMEEVELLLKKVKYKY